MNKNKSKESKEETKESIEEYQGIEISPSRVNLEDLILQPLVDSQTLIEKTTEFEFPEQFNEKTQDKKQEIYDPNTLKWYQTEN